MWTGENLRRHIRTISLPPTDRISAGTVLKRLSTCCAPALCARLVDGISNLQHQSAERAPSLQEFRAADLQLLRERWPALCSAVLSAGQTGVTVQRCDAQGAVKSVQLSTSTVKHSLPSRVWVSSQVWPWPPPCGQRGQATPDLAYA